MKTLALIKTVGSIACVAFALNASAQITTTTTSSTTPKESIGQHFDDGTITSKVKADLLGKKELKSTGIHVKTRRGSVMLTGYVPSSDQRTMAGDVASDVNGVTHVTNKLKVRAD
jgi:hyperosmotically inducible protein